MPYHLPKDMLEATFEHFRQCGRGREECQALWVSSWDAPEALSRVVHPKHAAHFGGFVLDDAWLNAFWLDLGNTNSGVRVQGHTHFSTLLPDHPLDLAVALGDTKIEVAAERFIRLNATNWSGSIERSAMPWRGDEWPLGGMAAGALASVEAFKCAMQKLQHGVNNPERLQTVFAPTDEVSYRLAPEETPTVNELGAFDCISGGAIIQAALYALSRVPNVTGHARVIEPDTADLSNLNRYAILRRQDKDQAKGEQLAHALAPTGLVIDAVDVRYDGAIRETLRLAPAVLVGVDDIPTRWEVQRANADWLAVGATTHWSAMASFHQAGLGCAECAHPYDDPNGGRIPTVAFVSFWAGLLTAAYFLRHLSGVDAPEHEQQTFVTPLRAENAVHSSVPARPRCYSCAQLAIPHSATTRSAVA